MTANVKETNNNNNNNNNNNGNNNKELSDYNLDIRIKSTMMV